MWCSSFLDELLLKRFVGTVVGKSKWYHQVIQDSFHLKRWAVLLNLTWVNVAFSCTKGYPGQVKRHSLPFQVEAALKYLMVPLTLPHDCTFIGTVTLVFVC